MKFGFSKEAWWKGRDEWERNAAPSWSRHPSPAVCPGRNEESASQDMNKDDTSWSEEELGDLGCQDRGIHVNKQVPQPFLQQLAETLYSSAQNSRMPKIPLLGHCSSIETESKDTESQILALVEIRDNLLDVKLLGMTCSISEQRGLVLSEKPSLDPGDAFLKGLRHAIGRTWKRAMARNKKHCSFPTTSCLKHEKQGLRFHKFLSMSSVQGCFRTFVYSTCNPSLSQVSFSDQTPGMDMLYLELGNFCCCDAGLYIPLLQALFMGWVSPPRPNRDSEA